MVMCVHGHKYLDSSGPCPRCHERRERKVKTQAQLIAASNSGPVSVDAPGDRGCVDCGKVIQPEAEDQTTYLLDARGRYWCLEHAVEALADVRRRHDERASVYKWSF